jgi:hypothetical protein
MSDVATGYESDDAVARRVQRALTDKVAVRLVRRSRSRNLRWSTWAERLGIHRHDRDGLPVS